MPLRSEQAKIYFRVLLILWTVAVAGLLVNDALHIRERVADLAIAEARAFLSKDQATRFWAASHGGVYVPVSAATSPNPFLAHVPERDIHTPSGKLLTLMNPAYMIRQVMEQYDSLHRTRGRITGLRHFREETAPDGWETRALLAFEDGRDEALEFTDVDGLPYLRLMQPLKTEASCLKCHAVQGDQVGGIRGGISLSLPMSRYLDYRRTDLTTHGLSFLALWLFGMGAIGTAGSRLLRGLREQDSAEAMLKAIQDNYRTLIDNSMTGIYISQDNTIKFANAKFAEIHEFSLDEIVGMDSLSLVLPEDRHTVPDVLGRGLRGAIVPGEYEVRCTTKSGKVIWVQRRNTVIQHNGRPAILGNEIEVTRRKQAEMELKASEELLKRLSGQLLQFQDAERDAMAREFNENIAQCLSAVKLRTEALLQPNENDTPPAMIGPLKQITEDLETTVAVVRDMTKRLSPLMVEDIGVIPAIQWLCRQLPQTAPGLRVRTRIQATESGIPNWLKTDIFRVLEKVLSLIVAQGRASRVKITLKLREGSLKLKIVDDDRGPTMPNPLEDDSTRGVDFVAVRSRVEARSGSVSWTSRPGSGNTVAIVWPLKGV
jgi:chemotaxis family two-component system sensor kinase Cph1